ncbi:hypothetical protein [Echinicola shivajiensis]|uniref:hypothetical protein n=1 Tax=Echinicola shivajiensis TaxID=1035916 RepID=UPI001BFC800E|nr:hypothetical protein [Echinicola shivajiensis]
MDLDNIAIDIIWVEMTTFVGALLLWIFSGKGRTLNEIKRDKKLVTKQLIFGNALIIPVLGLLSYFIYSKYR